METTKPQVPNQRRRWWGWCKRAMIAIVTALSALIVAFALGVWWPVPQLPAVSERGALAIERVSVVDVETGQLRPAQTVLVKGGRIVAVDAADRIKIPENTRRIDGRGRYLMPGLWDMHIHFSMVNADTMLLLNVRMGVTVVRNMMTCAPNDNPFTPCPDDLRRWSAEAEAGQRIGPRIWGITSYYADGRMSLYDQRDSLPAFFMLDNAEHGRQFARYYAGKVDAIKVYTNIPREAYFAMAEEAQRLGLELVGHRPMALDARETLPFQKTLEHGDFLMQDSMRGAAELRRKGPIYLWRSDERTRLEQHDPKVASEILTAMAQHGTWYVPTHLLDSMQVEGTEAAFIGPNERRNLHWLIRYFVVGELVSQGSGVDRRGTATWRRYPGGNGLSDARLQPASGIARIGQSRPQPCGSLTRGDLIAGTVFRCRARLWFDRRGQGCRSGLA
jgi:hypothetical protein